MGHICGKYIWQLIVHTAHVLSDNSMDIWYKYYELPLAGVLEGYCGCLTTVSSFVHEKVHLKRKDAVQRKNTLQSEVLSCEHEMKTYKVSIIYFFLTLFVAQILTSAVNLICYFKSGC